MHLNSYLTAHCDLTHFFLVSCTSFVSGFVIGVGLSVTMFLRASMDTLNPSSLQSVPHFVAVALSTGSHTTSPVSSEVLLVLLPFFL